MARTTRRSDAQRSSHRRPQRCNQCCDHGVALVWSCAYCTELEEFGTCDFGVWGVEMVMPCEHGTAIAS